MKFLVVSDIHCVSKDLDEQKGGYHGDTGSDFYIEERGRRKNPIFSIEATLKKSGIKVDAVLCLGDIAHQSKRLPFMQAWRDLHELAKRIDCKEVISVTGNHDILSRSEDVFDAEERMEFLRAVDPPFPSIDPDFNMDYFYHGFAAKKFPDCRVFAIDTCRAHGLGVDADRSKAIWETGHITESMRESIIDQVIRSEEQTALIMMHHHPIRVDDINDIYPDAMEVGARFLKDLGETGKKCILMHGHKHQVNLKISDYGSPAPVIFSAATFAAKPYPQQFRGFQNLFHVVEVDGSEENFPTGSILSWTWSGYEWVPSRHEEMPHLVPFGKRVDIGALATCLGKLPITSKIKKADLMEACPDLKFLQAAELDQLNDALEKYNRVIYLRRREIDAMVEAD